MVPHNINVHNRAKGARRYVIFSPCPSAVMKDSTLQIKCPAQASILASVTYSAYEDFTTTAPKQSELEFTAFPHPALLFLEM